MTNQTDYKFTNRLIHETSPYLLQHAHNPVDWYSWCEEAFEKATKENKLVLVSIGYSACHWCHVMERESFENEDVAIFMNSHFVCIKVDREERPDVDQVYMNALQLMTGQGGWPLNCFALPNGKPVYGGTYFPLSKWQNILVSLSEMHRDSFDKMQEYSEKLTLGIIQSDLISLNKESDLSQIEILKKSIESWKLRFDNLDGGPNRAPKFPLPNNYLFLLRYAYLMNDFEVLGHVNLTLDKMAKNGLFDQLGGGFSRYSTDMEWKVPHFEKMLYDNAQLVSLYSEAFQATGNLLYKDVVYKTVRFIERELMSAQGAFFSALDADSEGQEGKFYVWQKHELELVLGSDFLFIQDYYQINETGYWEHGNYILLRNKSDTELCLKWALSTNQLELKVQSINKKLFKARSSRIRPGLDDKILTSWNGLMLKGLVDAYVVFNDSYFLNLANRNADFILSCQKKNDDSLFHSHKNGKSTIVGFLEDYAFVIEALVSFYEATFNEKWLMEAKKLADYVYHNFYDLESGMFFFTSKTEKPLIARKIELTDNVTPASNSSMAISFFKLSRVFDLIAYEKIASHMLSNMTSQLIEYGSGYSNWGNLMLNYCFPFSEVIITGSEAAENRSAFHVEYLPNVFFAGSKEVSELPILQNRFFADKNLIFVCLNKTCKLPVTEIKDALAHIKN